MIQAAGCLFSIVYIVAWLGAAHAGLALYVSPIWEGVIFIACLLLRFTAPLTVFCFLGAWLAWQWPSLFALLLAAPSLAFALPAMLGALVTRGLNIVRGRRGGRDGSRDPGV